MKNYSIAIFYALIICSISFNCKDNGEYHPVKNENISTKNDIRHKVIAKNFENAGMYTYVEVSENNEDYWVAIPKGNIEIGQTYFYKGGMKMVNFKSTELNKTFDEVWFLQDLYKDNSSKNNSGHSQNKTNDLLKIIQQPENGTSLEKLLSDPESFKNKEIIIKGQVVKINKNILERNWIHLKDGTTFNDKTQITITSKDSASIGDIVTIKGKLILDKDFGYGYVYPVLIENGELIN